MAGLAPCRTTSYVLLKWAAEGWILSQEICFQKSYASALTWDGEHSSVIGSWLSLSVQISIQKRSINLVKTVFLQQRLPKAPGCGLNIYIWVTHQVTSPILSLALGNYENCITFSSSVNQSCFLLIQAFPVQLNPWMRRAADGPGNSQNILLVW